MSHRLFGGKHAGAVKTFGKWFKGASTWNDVHLAQEFERSEKDVLEEVQFVTAGLLDWHPTPPGSP